PLKIAPKIFKDTCKINWNQSATHIHNLVRGLSPVPAAFAYLTSENLRLLTKIYKVKPIIQKHNLPPGTIVSDGKTYIKVASHDGYVEILSLQLEGKKKLSVEEFLNGFKNITEYRFD
ncbi:MAG: methionyl-tRNA formyltransferase, partial [Bacteroidales bacterium]|nr:methionyl-tRNA formyltransferase [Bacteroidales bacterium]